MLILDPKPGRELFFGLAQEVDRKSWSSTNARVSIREPAVLKLDSQLIGDDPVLLAEHQRLSAQYQHYFVSFGCTFMPTDMESISAAEVEVRLDPTSVDAKAFIHSMRPDKLVNATEITSSAKLDADFQLASVGVGGSAKFERESLFLAGYPFGDHGYWEFKKTAHAAVAGQFPLQLIVRAPAGPHVVNGWISLSVEINRKRFYIVSEHRREETASIGFTCL